MQFQAPFALQHHHTQTLIGSTTRSRRVAKRVSRADSVISNEKPNTITASNGARLVAFESFHETATGGADLSRPMIVIIHGWLGNHTSGYLLSLADELWQAGFNVTRLNMRDHGQSAHLNEGMFHNGLIDEVIDAVNHLQEKYGSLGLCGFSLGGNFALRVCRALGLPTLAVCPLINPADSIAAVDAGWFGYKVYFMRKWFGALREKQQAYPDRYDFDGSGAFKQKTVVESTKHFVEHFSPYKNLKEYFDLYCLSGNALLGVNAHILAAADDPIVPIKSFVDLPVETRIMANGGHCAFLDSYSLTSFVDRYAIAHFEKEFAFSIAS